MNISEFAYDFGKGASNCSVIRVCICICVGVCVCAS